MVRFDLDENLFLKGVDRMWWGDLEPKVDRLTKVSHPFLTVRFAYDDLMRGGKEPNLLHAMSEWEAHLMEKENLPDIPYNFLIGDWGIVYEGRGWTYEPHDTTAPNTICICYIGDFADKDPNWDRIYAAHNLILVGIKEKYIQEHFWTIPYKAEAAAKPAV